MSNYGTDALHVPIDLKHDVEEYQHFYVVAHEFSRAAETLREKAGLIEDSVSAVSDLFDLTDD